MNIKIKQVYDLQTELDRKLSTSGGIVTGGISATTFVGDGSGLTNVGGNVFLSGGTLIEVTTGATGVITIRNMYPDATSEPTGFSELDTSDFTFDDATRTLTISATNTSFRYWLKQHTFPVLQ